MAARASPPPAPPPPPPSPSSTADSTPKSWPLWPWLIAGGTVVAVGALWARSIYLTNARRAELVSGVRARLSPSIPQLLEFFEEFKSEMRTGLQADGKSSMKMIPTYVNRVPTGSEVGEFYALDLGGTNFRVLKVKLGEGRLKLEAVTRYSIPEALMRGSGDALFDFIAESLEDFLRTKDPSPPPAEVEKVLGFTFSFPVHQTGLASGELIRWTKGFSAVGVEGKDVVQLLQNAAARRKLRVRVSVLANDTVGTWATTAVTEPRCNVGVILGTGSNAAYVERLGNVKKWTGGGAPESHMVINMEWGNFDSERRRVLPLTKYDEQLDLSSLNPGQQLFEKMLSGMYLGELARRVLVDLLNHRVLCPGHRDAPWKGTFTEEHSLQTADLSKIEADSTPELSATKEVLDRLHVYQTSLDDRQLVKEICHLVARRAALLAGTAVAAIASHTNAVSQGCTVAIDGSVYEHYPGFKELMQEAVTVLLGSDFAPNVKLVLSKDGSGLGAAVLAALAVAFLLCDVSVEPRVESSNVSARVHRWLLSPVQPVPLALQPGFDAFALIDRVGRQLQDLSSLQYSEEDAWDAGGLLGEGPEPEDTSEEALRTSLAIKIVATALFKEIQESAVTRRVVEESISNLSRLWYSSEESTDQSLSPISLLALCVGANTNASPGNPAALAVFLLVATFLERTLSDMLYSVLCTLRLQVPSAAPVPSPSSSDAPQEADSASIPAILRDLLRSPMLTSLLGPQRVLVLRLFLAAPAALNARNVAWHGFLSSIDFPPQYALLCILLLSSLESLLDSLRISAPNAPVSASPLTTLRVPFTKRRKVNLSTYTSTLPLASLLSSDALASVCTSSTLPVGRASAIHWASSFPSPLLKAVLLLPIIEMRLRVQYVAANQLPGQILSAQSRVYYSTMEMMLEDTVPLTGKPNELLSQLGPTMVTFLLDLFMYPEGPRLRGRLSHGDATLASIPHSLIAELELLLIALCVPSSPAALYLNSHYTSRYHPKALLRLQLLSVHTQLSPLAAVLDVLSRDIVAPAGIARPADFEECLRHLLLFTAPLSTLLPTLTLPPPVPPSQTLTTPAAVMSCIVCVRKLCEKLRALLSVLAERISELRRQTLQSGAGRRVVTAFDRLIASLPRLLSLLYPILHFTFSNAVALFANSMPHTVKTLQRVTVHVEKAVAPVAEHSWAKADAQLNALAQLILSTQ